MVIWTLYIMDIKLQYLNNKSLEDYEKNEERSIKNIKWYTLFKQLWIIVYKLSDTIK